MPPILLGEFEQLVLLAVLRLGDDAYGAAITEEIERSGGREVSVSAVHTTLDRLQQKGLARSRMGEPTPLRGGKRKRHFTVSPAGVRSLRASYRSWRGLTRGLEELLGGPA
jgi:PadR family transcriptional regulator, regulatory protein PadR